MEGSSLYMSRIFAGVNPEDFVAEAEHTMPEWAQAMSAYNDPVLRSVLAHPTMTWEAKKLRITQGMARGDFLLSREHWHVRRKDEDPAVMQSWEIMHRSDFAQDFWPHTSYLRPT